MTTDFDRQNWLQVFDDASAAGRAAAERGAFDDALRCFDLAQQIAVRLDDERRVQLITAKRAAITIEDGGGQAELPALRELLVRNLDVDVCRYAAYNLARWYELQKEYGKALFYARVAREKAALAEEPEWIAASHNQLGNVLLAQSKVEEAAVHYEQALQLMPAVQTPARARVLDNLGYCRVLAGKLGEGFTLLYASLRILRWAKAERYSISTLLDLSYAMLEARRYPAALKHGRMALELARQHGDHDSIKNAYFLLGEAANLTSDSSGAQHYFSCLQREYFPQQAYLPDFLLAVDVRKLVNLHA